ncbi:MAG: ATP-binding cassette domain-containing protein [Deltaproteobacteria bacterium]|nr:ATP-binding cassette domain-containing protein [Deltaproteobacteria bacterium]
MSLLVVNNVSKAYSGNSPFGRGGKVQAVSEVTFSLEDGDCLGIVGESGSGKSSLGRLLVGLEKPDSGQVLFQDHQVDRRGRDKALQSGLQMVFQDSNDAVNPRFSATKILAEPLKNFFDLKGQALRDRVGELLEAVGIPASECEKYPSQFSGGQLQRICIARALAAKPKLIVLDEPLRGLDVSVQAQILNLLSDLRKNFGVSYIFISHDLEAVYNLANRLAVMFGSRLVEMIDDLSLFNSIKHPYSLALMASAQFRLTDSPPLISEKKVSLGGCVYSDRCPQAFKDCFAKVPPLISLESGHLVACHLKA